MTAEEAKKRTLAEMSFQEKRNLKSILRQIKVASRKGYFSIVFPIDEICPKVAKALKEKGYQVVSQKDESMYRIAWIYTNK